ncbi:hypothetical protein [Streptomyces sp. URMC 129]|uniref:hypothetical protein n=1 Tax=Streptomyces sp. URMC 129 TaxID=3423407 RepID=UPI003F1C222D
MTDTTTEPNLAEIQTIDHHATSEPATGQGGDIATVPRPRDPEAMDTPEGDVELGGLGTATDHHATGEPVADAEDDSATRPRITKPKPGNDLRVARDHHATDAPAKGAHVPVKPKDDGADGGDAA